jgi:serine/threonine protein kinase
VAVKFILREKIGSDLWTKDSVFGKLPLEVSILSKLHHPNIIRYLTHFTEGDRFILVTELHGTQWTADNKELNPVRNPGLLRDTLVPVTFDPTSKTECSPLHRLTPEQEKNIRRRVPCDLFQCIDARGSHFSIYFVERRLTIC